MRLWYYAVVMRPYVLPSIPGGVAYFTPGPITKVVGLERGPTQAEPSSVP